MSNDPFVTYLAPVEGLTQPAKDLKAGRDKLTGALQKLEGAVVPADMHAIEELIDRFGDFSAKVSLIGQVKAGKTALANALLGVSDLLPSDVNPWTSVVTSMHINCVQPKGKRAVFRFFEEKDWEDMVSNSGRIVQLAKKAKLDSRVGELTEQIELLKAKTEERLGRNFKMLLGNQHSFSSYNADLIKRYVCLGDDTPEDREGRFADLTKSADLYLDDDRFAYPLTIADTPGVNDPFLVREAATIDNLGASHVCIVVLSAHQALSSVDLGLLRLLKSLRSNRLIVFVNRIDELPDPHRQIKEIEKHIRGVFAKQKLSGDIPVVFGSAVWADAAILGSYDNLPEDSVESLAALVEARCNAYAPGATDMANIENLADVSGISALRAAIDNVVWNEVYKPKIAVEAQRASRIAERSLMYLVEAKKGPDYAPDINGIDAALRDLDEGRSVLEKALTTYRDQAINTVRMDMAKAYMAFIKKEKVAISACLEAKGNVTEWVPDTEGLRAELNAVYNAYAEETERFFSSTSAAIVTRIAGAYRGALGSSDGIRIMPQPLAEPPIPTSLMRTMSIDLRASSSLDWLRRKFDKSVYFTQFSAIANEDLRSTVDETCSETIEQYLDQAAADFIGFYTDHARTIGSFARMDGDSITEMFQDADGAESELHGRMKVLKASTDVLATLLGEAAQAQVKAQTAERAT